VAGIAGHMPPGVREAAVQAFPAARFIKMQPAPSPRKRVPGTGAVLRAKASANHAAFR
jgi:hypothetical protein